MSTTPARGDIILVSLDPTLGHEQAGKRPAVVLSPDSYNKASGLCLVCPVTTQVKGYPFEVDLVGAKKTTGVALADQIRSIDWKARETKVVDRVSSASLALIIAKFKPLISNGSSFGTCCDGKLTEYSIRVEVNKTSSTWARLSSSVVKSSRGSEFRNILIIFHIPSETIASSGKQADTVAPLVGYISAVIGPFSTSSMPR